MAFFGLFAALLAAVGVFFQLLSRDRRRAEQIDSDRRRSLQRRASALQLAAARFGGRLRDESWGLIYTYQVEGVDAELSCYTGGIEQPSWTRVHFDWAPSERLRVFPEGAWTQFKKLFGAQDVQIGDAEFDARFAVLGSSEPWAREALSGGACKALLQLRTLGSSENRSGDEGVQLDANAKGVVLSCERDLSYRGIHSSEGIALPQFLELSAAVLRELKRTASSGKRVVISVTEVDGPDLCPVCGDGDDRPSARCDGCNTSYHPECWEYLGGCATFGCGARYTPGRRRRRGSGW
ncbi:MAG: hypothetical protein KDD82_07405 [Planctomycetes bacterium]|nr:hypothetical protein [Planctomycetota bacterium]